MRVCGCEAAGQVRGHHRSSRDYAQLACMCRDDIHAQLQLNGEAFVASTAGNSRHRQWAMGAHSVPHRLLLLYRAYSVVERRQACAGSGCKPTACISLARSVTTASRCASAFVRRGCCWRAADPGPGTMSTTSPGASS